MVSRRPSVTTMSAADRAASVAWEPRAMPTSARRIAGASLAPSPVMATNLPACCRAFTSRSFCMEVTLANTEADSAAQAKAVSSIASTIGPVRTVPSVERLSSPAMALAVAGWSQVMIFTAMPARWRSTRASFAVARIGLASPRKPTNSSSRTCESVSDAPSSTTRRATASTRRPWPARAWAMPSSRLRLLSSISTAPVGVRCKLQAARTISGEPFTQSRQRPLRRPRLA
jgi:hypothetical protein